MIFKLHYGLWYGALVGIIPFMFNYAYEYSGATGTQHGILYTILPFVALLAKPIVCSFADKYAAHHKCLVLFIFLTMIGFGSLAIYPFYPNWAAQHKEFIWIAYCIAALVGNTSMCVVNSIGDSLAINSCTKKNVTYGEYRLWGPVGFGIFGAIWGLGSEIPSMPKYTPGLLTLVLILLIDIILLTFWHDKDEFKILSPAHEEISGRTSNYGSTELSNHSGNAVAGDNRDQVLTNRTTREVIKESKKVKRLDLLLQLAREHKSVFVYIFIFTFCGIMTGIHWQFFFKYLQQVATDKNLNFYRITALALPVQALGGELVFFIFAAKILKALGAPTTLVVCLFSFATRYLLYAYFVPNVNTYWVLLVELFQGPAFGLMYCVLTHQANIYSEKIDEIVARNSVSNDVLLKKSTHATLQGILGASFEGLGLGLGAIVGGRAYDTNPILMWQIAGYSALAVAMLYLFGTILLAKIKGPKRQTVELVP